MTAAKGEITVQTDSVSREAFVSGNSIHLRTGAIPGATYAYYLTHKRGLEKQFYTNSTAASFHLPSLPGFYVATFFYKVGDAKASHKLVFVVDGESRLTIVHKREVATAAQYRIDYYDRGADTTFIVFNGSGSTLQSVPFGLNFLIAQGFNVLACLHNNDQYQGLSFEEFETHVKPVVQDKTVFLYGSSLGAYSALYYAGAVNGHVISAAPRNSAHPSVIARHGAASKYKPEGFKHKNYAENKLTDGRVYIVVDPHEDQDMAFLRDFVLDVYPRAEVIRFPYAGHQVLFHVNRTGQLKRIIQDIVADAPEIQADPDLHSEYSDAGRARHYFAAGDYENAKFYAERALARAADAKPIESALRALLRDIETLNASLEDR